MNDHALVCPSAAKHASRGSRPSRSARRRVRGAMGRAACACSRRGDGAVGHPRRCGRSGSRPRERGEGRSCGCWTVERRRERNGARGSLGLALSIGLDDSGDPLGAGMAYAIVHGINRTLSRVCRRIDVLDGLSVGDAFSYISGRACTETLALGGQRGVRARVRWTLSRASLPAVSTATRATPIARHSTRRVTRRRAAHPEAYVSIGPLSSPTRADGRAPHAAFHGCHEHRPADGSPDERRA